MSSTTKPVHNSEDPVRNLEVKFDECMLSFEAKLNAAKPSTVQQLAAEFAQFKDMIKSALQVLKGQVAALHQITDDLDNRSRRKFLLFRGIAEGKDDDLLPAISNIVTSNLKLPSKDFTIIDIKLCYRVGSTSDSTRPRPVLVKFSDLSVRGKLWHSKKHLKGSGISMAEFLTARRRHFKEARSVLGMERCWTSEGVIFVKDIDGMKLKLTSIQQLSELTQTAGCMSRDEEPKAGRGAPTGKKRNAPN
ncbi:unnamed protein product, partial [Iphiclides podalirius]